MMKTGLFFTGGTEGQPATEWRGERISGVSYPRNIVTVWPDADLAAIGLAKPLDADASATSKTLTLNIVPGGYVFAPSLAKNAGSLSWTNITEFDELTVGGTDAFSYAGVETTTSGTLTIGVTNADSVQTIAAVSLQP